MDRVTVYRFTLDDAGKQALAPRAATAKAIRQIMGATPVLASAQVVDSQCLDCHGFLIEDACGPDTPPS